ncbi:MAG: recombination mediator RecR [Alphaproteobacteria bacterium]
MHDGPLQHLIKMLSGLPGLGNRSARRIALNLLSNRQQTMLPLAQLIERTAKEIQTCSICANLDMIDPCSVCQDVKRGQSQICVIAQVSDLWAIERTGAYKGRYHVLGGLLSALDGIGPDQLNAASLFERAKNPEITEIILALSATVDGQSTAHYIADHIRREGLEVTHLAHGVPVGGELDYLDDGTITTALRSRKAS